MVKYIILIFIMCKSVTPASILCLFLMPALSRQAVYQIIVDEFAKRGHELVVIRPKLIDVSTNNVTYIETEVPNRIGNEFKTKTVSPSTAGWITYFMIDKVVESQYTAPNVQELIKSDKQFDLVLVEGSVRSAQVINAKFKAPVVLVSCFYGSGDDFYSVGVPVHPLLYPDVYLPKICDHSIWDKISMVLLNMKLSWLSWQGESNENEMIKRLFDEKSVTIEELQHHIQMLTMNVDHVWDCNRPVLPSVTYMGAIHLKEPKILPKDLQQYLDKSQHGVIYMSFGTIARSSDLPSEIIQMFMRVFETLPYDFLWKWDDEEPKHKPENVYLQKLFPQQDMLYHPKIKAFITHAGLLSTTEAIAANVPLIGIPIRVDQFMNAQKYHKFSIGVQLDLEILTENELKAAIIDVAENKSYRENIRNLNIILEEQRSGALQRTVRAIERIALFGGEHLRSPLAMISFVDYFVLDVFVPLIIISIAIATVVMLVLTKVFRSIVNIIMLN